MTASARTDSNADLEDSFYDGVTAKMRPALCARFNQELQKISAFIDSHIESIRQFLNLFANQPNETIIDHPASDNGSAKTPLVSPFPYSDNDSDDEEVLNELIEYENAGTLRRGRIINSLDGDNVTFVCMI
ncbi:hypothetical protein Tco_0109244 [Tanacetum coccineum]